MIPQHPVVNHVSQTCLHVNTYEYRQHVHTASNIQPELLQGSAVHASKRITSFMTPDLPAANVNMWDHWPLRARLHAASGLAHCRYK